MILLEKQPLNSPSDIQNALQRAIELEHSTIPPYLTAEFSIKPDSTQNVNNVLPVLHPIVIQEMKHLGTIANVLSAVGGHPSMNKPGFIPGYPGELPYYIGDRSGNRFEVGLRALTRDVVHETFMVIEEPDKPLVFPVKTLAFGLTFPDRFQTIGDFYKALSDALDASLFVSADASKQVTLFGLPNVVGADPATSLLNARKAIDKIRLQGEGTPDGTSPLQDPTMLAHYYLFAEIYNGKKLIADTSVPEGFSYSGSDVSIDPNGIYDLLPDATKTSYAAGDPAYAANQKFNSAYSALLDQLTEAFNGKQSRLNEALGTMLQLKAIAAGVDDNNQPVGMVTLRVTKDGKTYAASPSYTYLDPGERVPFDK